MVKENCLLWEVLASHQLGVIKEDEEVTGGSVDGGENRPVDVSGLIPWARGVDRNEDSLGAPLGWNDSGLGFSRLSEGASGL